MNVSMVTLGCPRALVDAEVALGCLKKNGYQVVRDVQNADIVIVNTCGFIEEAKKESIQEILELCELKKKGQIGALVVLGCLAQRYGRELAEELKEVDGIIGTDNYGNLAEVLAPLRTRQRKIFAVSTRPHTLPDEHTPRHLLTPPHTAYLKISEGCVHACSYCVIPKMKGPHRSRTVESVLEEAVRFADSNKLSEINLIGQDTAAFGYDRNRSLELAALLSRLAASNRLPWIRVLYAHPAHVTDELIDVIAEHSSICKYLDFPIEHSHDAVLKRMNRGVVRDRVQRTIQTLRRKLPGVAIRTTVMVGFPGETEEEFEDLMDFLKKTRFERLGAFLFSAEEGSRAATFENQIPHKTKQERYDLVMAQQREISREINERFIGRTLRVLIDEKDGPGEGLYYGRTEYDAPEVDGQVIVYSSQALEPGDFANVRITDALEYDLIGTADEPA